MGQSICTLNSHAHHLQKVPKRVKLFSVCRANAAISKRMVSTLNDWCSKIRRLRICHSFQKVMQRPAFQEGCILDLVRMVPSQLIGSIRRKSRSMSGGRAFRHTAAAKGQSRKTCTRSSVGALHKAQRASRVNPRRRRSSLVSMRRL